MIRETRTGLLDALGDLIDADHQLAIEQMLCEISGAASGFDDTPAQLRFRQFSLPREVTRGSLHELLIAKRVFGGSGRHAPLL